MCISCFLSWGLKTECCNLLGLFFFKWESMCSLFWSPSFLLKSCFEESLLHWSVEIHTHTLFSQSGDSCAIGSCFYHTRHRISRRLHWWARATETWSSEAVRGNVCRVRQMRSTGLLSGLSRWPPCPDGLDRTLQFLWLTAAFQKIPILQLGKITIRTSWCQERGGTTSDWLVFIMWWCWCGTEGFGMIWFFPWSTGRCHNCFGKKVSRPFSLPQFINIQIL